MTDVDSLLAQARAWLEQDPDPATAAQLQELIEAAQAGDDAQRDLSARFAGPLRFGTAGLRGPMGPGPARMNRVTVSRAAAGLAAFLNRIQPPAGRDSHVVVVGFDARRNSDVFARDTCEVMAGAGINVAVLPHALPTPVLAFAVAHLRASAGVMVTASHNPAADNGYKVYLGPGVGTVDNVTYAGSQTIPPHDAQIAECIDDVADIRQLPRSHDWLTLDHGIVGDYLARALTCIGNGPRHLRVVHTAMHGVGTEVFSRLSAMAGFHDVTSVAAQAAPDPDFPTVAFPNPEEPGALDLALAEARNLTADVVVANDPDADRCAVAVDEGGRWRRLSGDEVGTLLAWWLVARRSLATHAHLPWPGRPVFASSLVSSPWLRDFATSQSFEHRETLTGFKWLAQVPNLTFGYEEALGYAVDPQGVHDKDGITAALVVMEAAAHLKSQGSSLAQALHEIELTHGRWFTRQLSVRVADMAGLSTLFEQLSATPPIDIAGMSIATAEDLSQGVDGLPPTEGVRWHLVDGTRIIVRPSGTEPKIKCYIASRTDPAMPALMESLQTLLQLPA